MTPRHPPRALRDLTTPTRRRDPAGWGRGRGRMRAWGPCRRPRRLATRRPPPVTIPFRRVHVRGDDCATTTLLLQCDEQPDCQRTGQATAPRPAAPLGARPSASGSPAPATGQGAGQPSGCRAPHPAGAGRFLRRLRPIGSSPRRPGSRGPRDGPTRPVSRSIACRRNPRGEPASANPGRGTGPMWPRGSPERAAGRGAESGPRARSAVISLERR
jgi:hypothetical protein